MLRDPRGSVAILFGVMVIPLVGMVGVALDYSRAANLRSALQAEADALALNAAVNGQDQDSAAALASGTDQFKQKYGANAVHNLTFAGEWISEADFRVTANGRIDTTIAHILPGIGAGIDVNVEAVAHINQDPTPPPKPVKEDLDPDAGDYNQVYVYCFDYEGARGVPVSQHHRYRSQETLIADNDGTEYTFDWPQCGDGESLSYRMRNVRHAKAYPQLWNNRNQSPYRAEFDFYTDTVLIDGREHIDIVREIEWVPPSWRPDYAPGRIDRGYDMLETVRCDSLEECVGESKGGVIPEGKHRNPQREPRPCAPGKFMYYGWEDRPPHQPGPSGTWTDSAWTDRDYDDIRIVVSCPEQGGLGQRSVRLTK